MTIFEGLVVVAVLAAVGWIIYVGAAQKNPKIVPWTKKFFSGKLIEKIPPIKIPERMEQMYDEKRSMM